MKASETLAAIEFLVASYPRQEVSMETAQAYATMLADLPADAARAAIQRHIATSRFFPSIAELREIVLEERLALPTVESAAAEVAVAVRKVGAYGKPEWSSPLIGEALAAVGGFRRLCDLTADRTSNEMARFRRAFEQARRRAMDDENLRALPLRREPSRLGRGRGEGALTVSK